MGRGNLTYALALACVLTACSGGGEEGQAFDTGAEGLLGAVQLLEHWPADDATQVELGASITLRFDAAMALDSFGDEDTWLRVRGSSTNVAGSFAAGNDGRVVFTPTQALAAETDYVFQLSALTCDLTGRILDVVVAFGFRTFDETPPVLQSVDVAQNAQGVARTRSFRTTFNEDIGATSVTGSSCYLRDQFGFNHPAALAVTGATVVLTPYADLPGDRQLTLFLTNVVADRAGNRMTSAVQRTFRTAADLGAPTVTAAWPAMSATGVSPTVQPLFTFDESMDPASVEAASLVFQDEFSSVIPFTVSATQDQRSLRLRPNVTLQQNRRYTLLFLTGGAAATDVSGNGLAATQARSFTTGTDATAPIVVGSAPAAGEQRVPGSAVLTVRCSEALDAAFVGTDTVTLLVDGAPWTCVVDLAGADTVRVTPVLNLPTGTACELRLRGGNDGLHDLAGNPLAADAVVTFTTSNDAANPGAILLPSDGATNVSLRSSVVVVFDAAMDPTTLTSATVQVTDDLGNPVAGTLSTRAGNRSVVFVPSQPLAGLSYYRTRVVSGPAGARRLSGNWFATDRTCRWRTGVSNDLTAPTVVATVNAIPAARRDGLVLPPSGFTVDVTATDGGSPSLDMGNIEVVLTGPGSGPDAASLQATATIGYGTFSVRVPSSTPLALGNWLLAVRVSDLSGNVGTSPAFAFEVAQAAPQSVPFERTQLVFVRTDLDRDANGTADFDDDMLRLGFATAGDPAGTNAYLRGLVLDGILAQANHLYGRGSRGEPLGVDSVALRFTKRQPIGLLHMQMALGGLDPEGSRTRGYGEASTGVLGRAYYDFRNGNATEQNTATSPGLGVFPAEMWLYQARIHQQVYPSFQTVFAQRFLPICPPMGGTPAGSHPLDASVLRADFDYATASGNQRARWQTIMDAADDWALVTGIVLAHEVGHSVGLVAPGASPSGLFGDASLHDSYAGSAEVMAPSVGYEAMTALDYAFRDIDLAYLRHRVLLR